MKKNAALTIVCATIVCAATTSTEAVSVTAIAPNGWSLSDAQLGISGFQIEDFEDTTLISPLQIQLSGGNNDYSLTSTLPRTFSPTLDDPNAAKVFATGIWDGSLVLLNRNSVPIPINYGDNEWADLTFVISGGADSVGFSVEQMHVNAIMTVNTTAGSTQFDLSNVSNFTIGSDRNGYLRIDAGLNESIISILIDNAGTTASDRDGFAIDHFAIHAVPEPSAIRLLLLGLVGSVLVRRKLA